MGTDTKYPGFTSLLSYLKHLQERANGFKAARVDLSVETLEDVIEHVGMLEELQK